MVITSNAVVKAISELKITTVRVPTPNLYNVVLNINKSVTRDELKIFFKCSAFYIEIINKSCINRFTKLYATPSISLRYQITRVYGMD